MTDTIEPTALPESALARKIADRSALVGIIGLGYVGLPLARAFSRGGFRVLGFDTDANKVQTLNHGESYIRQIPDEEVRELRRTGFEATDHFERESA